MNESEKKQEKVCEPDRFF